MKRPVVIILLSLVLISIAFGAMVYFSLRSYSLEGLTESKTISCRSAMSIDQFTASYFPQLDHSKTFTISCKIKRFQTVKPGNYRLDSSMSNAAIIHHLRSGGNPVVNVRLDKAEDIFEVAGALGQSLRYDSAQFIHDFLDKKLLDSLKTDSFNIVGLLLPNTYEFYWSMSPRSFIERMMTEQRLFWNGDRTQKAKELNLTAREIVVLASIVKAETGSIEEAPVIAGLYLNRLRTGMPLQSDPTAIFGKRSGTQRVYITDIQSNNPYNTYRIKGLPPGPINLPEAVYIDAVLNAVSHTYFYMCAQPGGTGKHNFSINLAAHEQNRRAYIRWLNERNIK